MKEIDLYKRILEDLGFAVLIYSHNKKMSYANKVARNILKKCSYTDSCFLEENPSLDLFGKEYKISKYSLNENEILILLIECQNDNRIIESEKERSIEAFRSRMLSEMAGGLSHEINTPLGTITLCADLLDEISSTKYSEDDTLIETIKDVKNAAAGISDVIRSFKFFVRDDRSDQFIFYSLNDLILKVKNVFKILMMKYNVEFTVNNNLEEEDIVLECNPTKIAQILSNLIKNSLDEVKSLETKWIKLNINNNESSIVFQVVDSGEGVSEDDIPKIFTPLFSTKDVGEGSGIGLAICKEFVSEHNGDLQYLANFENTCFEVTIPKIQIL
jgi:signal transduction histidine kinase